MFPHTVTLYYTLENEVTFEQESYITILRGVLMSASKAANVRTSGLEGADAVNLYIPFDVVAVDGLTGAPKTYVSPKEFEASTDKSRLWTIDRGQNCFFAKGEVVDTASNFQTINFRYDDVYKVTKVDRKDYGGLQHFEIGGA